MYPEGWPVARKRLLQHTVDALGGYRSLLSMGSSISFSIAVPDNRRLRLSDSPSEDFIR